MAAKQINIKTDLLLEAHEILLQTSQLPEHYAGISTDYRSEEDVDISDIRIITEEAAEKLGKARGRYITLEASGLRDKNSDLEDRLSKLLYRELNSILPSGDGARILVVGLGNWNVTPDSLGPSVVENLYITRHLKALYPEKLGPGFRDVCAIAPGVLGLTGIETSEIIFGIVQRVKPDAVVAIDALAARSLHRLNTTIQISDTGIYPGSGVGNKRQGLTRETLGVPVIAVGIPTVVDAATLASDAIDLLIAAIRKQAISAKLTDLLDTIDHLGDDRTSLIREVMNPSVGKLMVTPKEVDRLLEDISSILTNALNAALHPRVAQEYYN